MRTPAFAIGTGRWLRAHNKAPFFVALLILVTTLAAYLYYWGNLRTNVQNDMNAAYGRQVRLLNTNMTTRLRLYETLLRGGAGLFMLDGSRISRDDWSQYFQPYEINKKYPDIRGIAFSRYVTAAQASALTEERIAEDPAFAITPVGDRPVYAPLVFIARYTGATTPGLLGYDGLSDPVRREAMLQAAHSGAPAFSGRIDVADKAASRTVGIMYLPVYIQGKPLHTAAERQAALYGFSYMSIDFARLFDSLLSQNANPNFGVRITDAAYRKAHPKAPPSYESSGFAAIARRQDSRITTVDTVLYGHTYTMTLAGSSNLISDAERQVPAQTLLRGVFSSLLFAAIAWYLITFRERRLSHWRHQEVQTAKDDLLSLASHQLRTPATVVKQYVGMLLQGYGGEVTKQQEAMLLNAYDSNERQLEIINQLLYVARLDAGRLSLRKEEVALAPLIRAVVKEQKQTAEERQQTVTSTIPKDLVLTADPRYLRMALENLLSNAIKYTPEGGSITLDARTKADGMVEIAVSDTGVGLTEAHIATIFDKFTRVDNTLSTDVNGSGVGLYLTKEIITLHGGHVSVTSEPGQGSVFTIVLPREES